MTDLDAEAAYQTFRDVVRDLVQPIITDIQASLDDKLRASLSDPKRDLACLMEETKAQGQTLENVGDTLDEATAAIATLSTTTGRQVSDLASAQAHFRADLEALHGDVRALIQRVVDLQEHINEVGRVEAARDRLTHRIAALTTVLVLVNIGIALWVMQQ